MAARESATDVLVVGAGPVGLALAVELARRGVASRIIDANAGPSTTSRALGTQARTIEMLGFMGVPPGALVPSSRVRAMVIHDGPKQVARVPLLSGRPDRSYDGLLVMAQSDTERVLLERLAALGGAVERSTALVGLAQDDRGATATLDAPDGEETVRARFVVGCDGYRSAVRRFLGIPFAGGSYPQAFALADLRVGWDVPRDEARAWFHPAGLFAALPLPEPGTWRLIADVPARAPAVTPDVHGIAGDGDPTIDLAFFQRLFVERTGNRAATLSDPTWLSAFRISRRMAERYREGRCFIAGDAAHVHSPVGGQGMNTGIQDAANLGWKLALAASGHAAPGLLDTYESERMPIASGVLDGTDLGMRLITAANPAVRRLRDFALPRLAALPGARGMFAEQVSELGINYRRSALAEDEAGAVRLPIAPGVPRAGDRAPQATFLVLPERVPGSLFDLIAGGGWTLLLLADPERPAESARTLAPLAVDARAHLGDYVRPFVVLPPGLPEDALPRLVPVLEDDRGEVRGRYGAGGAAILIRPDGYIGFRDANPRPAALWAYLARVFHPDLLPEDAV